MITAGIVLCNPDIDRLQENITSIVGQVDSLIFVDNASSNRGDIERCLLASSFNYKIICNEYNRGIAYALNQIMEESSLLGAKWVLTLDQDSVCPADLIEKLLRYEKNENLGIICPTVHDRSMGDLIQKDNVDYQYVESCITSASLTNANIWRKVGGFDNSMFIDGVDIDYCFTLHEQGYKVLQCMDVKLLHEIGHNSKITHILGHRQVVFNHSPFRYYYICRNIIYLNRKHPTYRPSPLRGLLSTLYRILLIILYETDKFKKIVASIKGCWDGFRVPIVINNNIPHDISRN